jgi:predicted molibdopterin-dependent oxidoreductase YjgC
VANADCADPAVVAKICRIELPLLLEFYELFAATRKTITAYSMGVNQSSAGTDKVNAIINCHLIGGRIGKPGMGPFSITGQPNAMGGAKWAAWPTCWPRTWIWNAPTTATWCRPSGIAGNGRQGRPESGGPVQGD